MTLYRICVRRGDPDKRGVTAVTVYRHAENVLDALSNWRGKISDQAIELLSDSSGPLTITIEEAK